ncbi:MAG TPA: bifunctional alpha,alpha-trehalose-phosphate synthase (UDP-forming)/trehalose-phosphatase [Gemmatimonadales bacterium]|nr:bifunctional alpha,alpha-trehalose-phosphate synthase (UDP-forming)/trehalose-phosphatase [Gemmatimonadales bacterium]
MDRLLIVANRLPVTVTAGEGGFDIQRSAGGLATGLAGPHERSGGLWIGWPGVAGPLPTAQQAELERRLEEQRLVPVELSGEEVRRFYEGVSNGVLWPVFHYLVDQIPLQVEDWGVYEAANRRFAECVASHWRPGDMVWVHDYQLLLVPGFLRELVPEARIGFFLHIPFPSSEVFRALPEREAILRGLLGADLIGFHTAGYLRHFVSSLTHLLGLDVGLSSLSYDGREVRLGVFPMGVDAHAYAALGEDPAVQVEASSYRAGTDGGGDVQLLVGIDRLDYTKGIPRRLLAYEHLLKTHPELCERVRLVQVAVPSRTGVEAYQEFRDVVDALMGRIQGAFATPRWSPIHYIYRSLADTDVAALYRAADALLCTPIRDGMNLVAKEFVATRTDGDGVLLLSEFAGAASEMAEAIHVNPYDVERTAAGIYEALRMPAEERRTRMAALRKRVERYDVHWWVRTFLEQLAQTGRGRGRVRWSGPSEVASVPVDRIVEAPYLILLLDYDGTLAPIRPRPELAAPDPDLLDLLGRLAARPNTEVHIVTGRTREDIEEWLGGLPVGLHAEHGLWSRFSVEERWVGGPTGDERWREPVRAMLEDVTARTPGSFIEEKTAGFAWHFRLADPTFGAIQANELRVHLSQLLSNEPLEILTGHKVIEVRPHGINKGRIVAEVLRRPRPAAPGAPTVVAIGDDVTDEDLFAALPEEAVSIRVGMVRSRARHRLATVGDVRALLRVLLD